MINLSVRQYTVTIAGLNCTKALISFVGSDSKIDQSGLITFKGTLVLGRPEGFESIDDRVNDRWARGNPINLRVADGAGVLKKPPRGGTLFILDSTYTPKDGRLEIQTGDLFELLRFREPKGDASKVCLGTLTPRTQIINNLLAAAGVPPLIDEVPGFLNVATPRLLENSYIEQAGAIAAAAGYYLWIDTDGNVRASGIAVNPASARIAIAVPGIADSQRVAGETPPAAIKVRGRATALRRNGTTTTIVSEEYGPAYNAGVDSSTEIITKRTLKRDQLLRGASLRIVTTTVYQPAGVAFPDDPQYQGVATLIVTNQQTERYQYESNYPIFGNASAARCQQGNQNRLKRYESISNQPAGSVLREVFSTYPKTVQVDKLQLMIGEQVITRYAHEPSTSFSQRESDADPDESWIPEKLGDGPRITKQTFRPIGAVVPSEFRYKKDVVQNPEVLIECERETQYWRETSFGEWRYSKDVLRSVNLTNPSLAETLKKKFKGKDAADLAQLLSNLTNAESEEIVSNAGQAQPPGPDSFQPEWSTKDVTVTGKALLPINAASPYRQPSRDLSFEYLSAVGFSEAQARETAQGEANKLAQLWGVLLWGKYKAVNYLTDLADSWWSYTPLARIDVQEVESKFAYLGDGWSISLAGNRCAIGFDGLLLGQTTTPFPNEPIVIDPVTGNPVPIVIDPDTGNPVAPIAPIYRLARISEIASSSAVRSVLRLYSTQTVQLTSTVASASTVRSSNTILRTTGGILIGGGVQELPRSLSTGGILIGGLTTQPETVLTSSEGGILIGGTNTQPVNTTVEIAGGVVVGGVAREMPRSVVVGGVIIGGTNTQPANTTTEAVGGVKAGGIAREMPRSVMPGGVRVGGNGAIV